MKCFIYCRQSVGTNEADDSMSLETQEEACKKLATSNGYTIAGIFKEANHSGRLYPTGFEQLCEIDTVFQKWSREAKKNGQYRPKLGMLLKRLAEVDYVVCYDLTRLHRSLQGSFLENCIIQEFNKHGTKVVTIKEGEIDFKKFTDTLMTTLTSQINSEQLKIQKDKSQAVIKRMRDSGDWSFACHKSFGYRSTGRKREVEIDPLKAEVVRTVFKMYTEGKSYYMISKAVNPKLYEATGKTLFKTHMCRMLQNPVYCGYTKASDGTLVKSKPIEGKEIIDFATWKKAQDIMKERKVHPKRDSKNWLPLSGRIICGYCGEGMRAQESNECDVQYRCFSYSKHGYGRDHSCRNGVTWNSERTLPGGDFIVPALMGLLALWYVDRLERAESDPSRDAEMQDLEVAILSIRTKQKTLTEGYLDGQIDEQLYKTSLDMLKKRLKEAETKLDELKSVKKVEDYSPLKLLFDLEALNAGDVEEEVLYQAMRDTFKKIVIWRDHIEAVTMKGSVELPIKQIGKWHARLLPYHYIAAGKNGEADVIYNWRFDEPHSSEDIIDYEAEGRKIADFGKVKVWIVD